MWQKFRTRKRCSRYMLWQVREVPVHIQDPGTNRQIQEVQNILIHHYHELHSLFRSAIMEARSKLAEKFINEQTLLGIMGHIPLGPKKQWTKQRPSYVYKDTDEAFWRFVHRKWRTH
jgi:hypothetical protein